MPLLGLVATTVCAQDDAKGIVARVEYALKTTRPRDPVLGGAGDKVSVSVWIPAGVKTVRGAVCNPFSKGDSVSAHWQTVSAGPEISPTCRSISMWSGIHSLFATIEESGPTRTSRPNTVVVE